MKKFYKKFNYLLITGIILSISFLFNIVEKSQADVPPACAPPDQQFSNGCFTPDQVAAWIAGGGDAAGGGDGS